jgi:peptidoglycan hydrolase-like protein with peptidoglycan-binding domain
MQGTTRPWPAGSRLVGILGVALALCLPQAAAAAERPQVGALLAPGQGYALANGSTQVKALQRRLRVLGEGPGPIDGIFGPRTEAAVRRLQLRSGIAVDGLVGPETRAALRRSARRPLLRGAGYTLPGGSRQVRQVQRRLRALGYDPGPIDGLFGPLTEAAVVRLQTDRALAVDGIVGSRTHAALGRLGEGEERRAERSGKGDQASQVERRGSRTEPRRASAAPKVERNRRTAASAKASPSPAGEGKLPLVPVLLGAALLLVAIAMLGARLALPWRLRSEPSVIPLGRGLELEGESLDPEIGRFTGRAYAVELPDVDDAEERATGSRFLLLDRRRKHPFWVDYSEVNTPLPPALQAHPQPWEHQASLKPGATVLGYVTVPRDPPERHTQLYAQLSRIEALCKRRRLNLSAVVRDVESRAKPSPERPGLAYALEQLAADQADALVVCGLERLGNGRAEIDDLLGKLSRSGAAILALQPEPGIQPGQVASRLAMIGSSKRRSGRVRQRVAEPDLPALRSRILSMRDRGRTLQAIADTLNDERVPPPRGAPKWRPASVRATLAHARGSSPRNVIEMSPPPGLATAEPERGGRKGGRSPT